MAALYPVLDTSLCASLADNQTPASQSQHLHTVAVAMSEGNELEEMVAGTHTQSS